MHCKCVVYIYSLCHGVNYYQIVASITEGRDKVSDLSESLHLVMDNIDYVTGIGNRSHNTDMIYDDAHYLELAGWTERKCEFQTGMIQGMIE